MAVKKRCGFCLRVVRADGTCQNEKCPRYVPEKEPKGNENQINAQTVESEE